MQNRMPHLVFSINNQNEICSYFALDKSSLFTAPENFLNKSIQEVFQSEGSNFIEMIEKARVEKSPAILNYQLMINNSPYDFTSAFIPVFDISGEISSIQVFIRDCTLELIEREKNKDIEQRFKKIVETANSGIVFGNRGWKVLECNAAFCKILEITEEELKNRGLDEFTHPEDLVRQKELIRQMNAGEINGYRLTKRYITKKGNTVWVDVSVSIVREEGEKPAFFLGIVNDITREIELTENLKTINAAKDRLLSIIGHDLRGPLGNIHALSEILVEAKNESERAELTGLIKNSAQISIDLLNSLLEWGKSQLGLASVKKTRENVTEIILEAIHQVQHSADLKNIRIHAETEGVMFANIDAQMILTVLRNVLMNAIKFSYPSDTIECRASISGDFIKIETIDHGIGMDTSTKESLFNIENQSARFGTLNERGSGLGLHICKNFIDLHNGSIIIDSSPNKGTKLAVLLPIK